MAVELKLKESNGLLYRIEEFACIASIASGRRNGRELNNVPILVD